MTYYSLITGIESRRSFLVGPGVFPFILSLTLVVLSAVWCIGLIRKNGIAYIVEQTKVFLLPHRSKIKNLLKPTLLLGFSVIYVFVLLNYLHYVYATFIFLLVLITYFSQMKIYYSIILAAVVSAFIYYVFHQTLYLPLP